MNKLLVLDDISKNYMDKQVLRNISFSIVENEVLAILGGNGTGKSTLLKIIAGIEQPSSGNVEYYNNKLKIGFVPERFPKHIRFTPSEYLLYLAKMSGTVNKTLKNRIGSLLHRFQLDDMKHKRIMELSKGNLQKVGIIQAIVRKPDLLILDEPLSGLDSHSQEELVKLIGELKLQGSGIILTYHETNIFEKVVEKSLYLNNGTISSINLKKNEPIKLLVVCGIKETVIKQWKEIIQVEKKDSLLYLYVSLKDSDAILSRILQRNGSVETVSTVIIDDNRRVSHEDIG